MAAPPRKRSQTRVRIEYVVYRLLKLLARILPEGLRLRLGPWLGRVALSVDRRHRRVALHNLRLALPELGEPQRRLVARGSFESFGSQLVGALASSFLEERRNLELFECESWEYFEQAEAHGRGMLLITAHFGAWEALGPFLALSGKPFSFVARPLDNPLIESDYRRIRERHGNRTIPKRGGARDMLRVLRSGGRIVILVDQRVHPKEGKAYPFFGRPAFTTPLPARLSLRTGAPVVPLFAIPIDEWRRCRVEFHPPILPDPELVGSPEAVDFLTTRYIEVIEHTVRRDPHLWLWMHRRWRRNPWYPPPDSRARPERAVRSSETDSPASAGSARTDHARPVSR